MVEGCVAGRLQQVGVQANPMGVEEPVFTFPRENGTLRRLTEVGVRLRGADPFGGAVLVRPKVGDGAGEPPSEFPTLYALMFCLYPCSHVITPVCGSPRSIPILRLRL